jgi:hypothetical protein
LLQFVFLPIINGLTDSNVVRLLVLVIQVRASIAALRTVGASSVTALLTTLDGSKLTDDIRNESPRAMVNSFFELSLD